jgi:hypothetical protein
MIDYSESLIAIKQYRKKAHDLILKRDYLSALEALDQIQFASQDAKAWVHHQYQLEKNK